MKTPPQFSRHQSQLVASIYAAAIDGERIPNLLQALSTFLDGSYAQLYTVRGGSKSVVDAHISNGSPQEIKKRYLGDWLALDPVGQRLQTLPMGDVVNCHQHFDDAFVASNRFYQDFFIPSGFRWTLAGTFPGAAGTATTVSIVRAVGRPAFEDWAASALRQLIAHLEQAWQLATSLRQRSAAIDSARELLEAMPAPCVFTDEAGRCIRANAAFEQASDRLSLRIVTGRIRFQDPELQRLWEVALWETHATAVGRTFEATTPAGRQWGIQLLPCDAVVANGMASDRKMIAAIFDERLVQAAAAADAAVSKARLTRAELEVLAGLLKGLPAKSIADRRGASVNTVRSQIMAVLEKTGFRSQKELIASFGSSSFPNSAFGSSAFRD